MAEQRTESASRARQPRTRTRASHSLESVLAGAVEILDESGAQGLTIRALAARLGGGVASVYWYVSGRDELLDLAADSVLGGIFDQIADVVKTMAVAFAFTCLPTRLPEPSKLLAATDMD